jgi:hypothetical protein
MSRPAAERSMDYFFMAAASEGERRALSFAGINGLPFAFIRKVCFVDGTAASTEDSDSLSIFSTREPQPMPT